jgi:hypothetical protein
MSSLSLDDIVPLNQTRLVRTDATHPLLTAAICLLAAAAIRPLGFARLQSPFWIKYFDLRARR